MTAHAIGAESEASRLWSVQDVAEYLQISVQTLKLFGNGCLPMLVTPGHYFM
jgi:hypothetical protein